ncbi:hypothetical protein SCUCBS95973_001444 [Sporothrix curviconia]|uniref:Membrane insertase YidC/Oxa/ALB C-terminal domain-containing protein n=1 Tax=Sporothrix curviconia TaxID=1260050 RepID=A0ABP0AYN6_9PEZI
MLPSRGLVQSSQALRLRQLATATRPHARSFGTALRSRSSTPATAAGLSMGRLSGRRVASPTTPSSLSPPSSTALRMPPSSAAAFSLWPFSSSGGGSSKGFSEADIQPRTALPPASELAPDAPAASTLPPPSSSPVSEPISSIPSPAAPSAADTTSSAFSAALPDPQSPQALSDLIDGSALLDMPSDQLGYLAALGLDFGWGPTSMCQWLLEHVHVYTGLPWWASIVGAALVFRAAIFWPSLTAAEHSAKLQVLRKNPRYAAAMSEMSTLAMKGGTANQAKAMEARLTMKRMQEAMHVSTWKMFVPMINVPFGYGMFRLLRSMAALPVPDLETGGILWFTDLTVPDPYFVLPLTSAAIMYLIFRSNMKYMAPEQQQTMKYVQMAITPISILVTVKMSAGLTFFFAASSILQLIQTWLWHQPWLRALKGLPPMHEMLQGGALNNVPGGGAARPAPFRIDPQSSWKAPRTTATGVPENLSDDAAKAAAAEESLTRPPSAVELAKKGWNAMMGNAKEKQSASKDKEVLRKANDYEKRRSMEDESQLYQRREAERQYRAMKRGMAEKKTDTPNKWQ